MTSQNFSRILQTLKISNSIFFIRFYLVYIFISCLLSRDAFCVEVTPEISQIAEDNGIAQSICHAIDIGIVLMTPMFAIMFTIIGFSVYQGKIKWSVFVTFAVGMAAFKGAPDIANFFIPGKGLRFGCKCAIATYVRDENGHTRLLPTNLNLDCSKGLEDYEKHYGPID